MTVTIRRIRKQEARDSGVASGWSYWIDDGDGGMSGYGFSTYRATLTALLRFAQ